MLLSCFFSYDVCGVTSCDVLFYGYFSFMARRNVRGLTFSYESLLQKFKSLLYSSVLTGEFIAYMDNIVVKRCHCCMIGSCIYQF